MRHVIQVTGRDYFKVIEQDELPGYLRIVQPTIEGTRIFELKNRYATKCICLHIFEEILQ